MAILCLLVGFSSPADQALAIKTKSIKTTQNLLPTVEYSKIRLISLAPEPTSHSACPTRFGRLQSRIMSPDTSSAPVTDPLTHSLDLLSDTYNYNLWIYSLLRSHIGEDVLEVGAGVGNITRFLLPHARVVCLEPDPNYAASLRQLASAHRNLEVVQADIQGGGAAHLQDGTFDTVLCINVLEHIKDDANAVSRMLSCLRPGGKLLLYVPACPSAFGVLDTNLGHFRRYSRRALRRIAKEAGGGVLSCRFVNMPGYFGWMWSSRIARETRIDPGKARVVDKLAPYISAFEKLIPPPIGQSLLAVIVK